MPVENRQLTAAYARQIGLDQQRRFNHADKHIGGSEHADGAADAGLRSSSREKPCSLQGSTRQWKSSADKALITSTIGSA